MRRRRNRGTWLPLVPTSYDESSLQYTYFEGSLTFGSSPDAGDTTQAIQALTLDTTPQLGEAGNHVLRDYVEGQEYILERVVGKVWFAMDQNPDTPSETINCIGLCVLPVDDENPTVPSVLAEDWNPIFAGNAQQPWLWRRTWRLSNNSTSNYYFPTNTGFYGSVADGGHLDTKGTKRRIGKEQRIFIVASSTILTAGAGMNAPSEQLWGYDLRLFGAMRTGKNRSSFK